MASTVGELRFSFTWVESFLALLLGKGSTAPRAFLADPQGYTSAYESVIAESHPDPKLAPVWSIEYSHPFWRYYSGHRRGMPSRETWRAAVPFHITIPMTLSSPVIADPLEVHGYLYSFGLALEVSGCLRPAPGSTLALDKAVDLAQAVRGTGLEITWAGSTAAPGLLEPTANEALGRLRVETLGPGTAPEDEVSKPFSVVTFVLVEGEDPTVKVDAGSPVHKALQGLASWYPGWRDSAIGTLEDKRPDILSSAPAAHILYSTSRARVGWFPSPTSTSDPENRRFRSYHRSQVCTITQLEVLTRFVKRSAARIDQGKVRSPLEEKQALVVAQLIGRMYGGSQATYRTESTKFYIDQNDLKYSVNRVLHNAKKPELYIPQ